MLFSKGFFSGGGYIHLRFSTVRFYNTFHCLNFLLLKRIILPCKEVFLHPCIPSVVGWIHVLLLSLAVISQSKKSPSSMFSSKTNSAKPHSSFCYSSLNYWLGLSHQNPKIKNLYLTHGQQQTSALWEFSSSVVNKSLLRLERYVCSLSRVHALRERLGTRHRFRNPNQCKMLYCAM